MGELHERHNWRKERTKESVFHKINKERSISTTTKQFKILVLVLITIPFLFLGLSVIGTRGLSPSYTFSKEDPIVPIYYFCNTAGNLNRFDSRFATIGGGGPCGNHVINLASNSTSSAFAIDSQPIDLSSVGGHHLQINMAFEYTTTPANQPIARMFLTTNKTAPLEQRNYVAQSDPNILFSNTIFPNSNSVSVITYVRSCCRFFSITAGDSGCGSGGSAFICGSQTGNILQGTTISVFTTLNYTGVTSSQTLSQTCITIGGNTCTGGLWLTKDTQYRIPPTFYKQTVYWGIEQEPNSNGAVVQFWDNLDPVSTGPADVLNHWLLGVWNPPAVVNPYLDSGGFLGAVDRGLYFVYDAVSGFLGTAYNAITVPINPIDSWISVLISGLSNLVLLFIQSIKIFLNSVGSLFGIGSLGDSVINFFTGIATFFSSVIAGGFSILDELATEGNRVITTITNFFTNGLSIFNFINDFLNSMSGLWSIIVGAWNEFLHWYNLSSMGISYFLVLWYFFGIYQVYLDGIQGLKSWLDMSEMFLLSIFKAGYWFSKESFSIVLTIKQLVAGWV